MSPFGWEIIPPKRAHLLSGLTTWEMEAALTRGQISRRRVDAVLAKVEHPKQSLQSCWSRRSAPFECFEWGTSLGSAVMTFFVGSIFVGADSRPESQRHVIHRILPGYLVVSRNEIGEMPAVSTGLLTIAFP